MRSDYTEEHGNQIKNGDQFLSEKLLLESAYDVGSDYDQVDHDTREVMIRFEKPLITTIRFKYA
ncbi:hypothetical protein [Clostridium sp.]|uniref:hypothetical protein n=1 Tax=Clostridium sp. TaxID=1506 RepID=UPI00258F06A7|nr:hypothetical protein [Clostridium sp.]